jgi:hypothetical protein
MQYVNIVNSGNVGDMQIIKIVIIEKLCPSIMGPCRDYQSKKEGQEGHKDSGN